MAIGEQAVVADPHEAHRQDVEQEATDELEDVEVHDLLFVSVGGVAVSECYAVLLDAQDTMVRDRDAMRVGAEIGEDSFGSCERGLRVDDPGATTPLVTEPRNGSVGAEVSPPEGAAEAFRSEGSGRISGLSWAEGLVELPDGAADIRPGDPVRFLPYAMLGLD